MLTQGFKKTLVSNIANKIPKPSFNQIHTNNKNNQLVPYKPLNKQLVPYKPLNKQLIPLNNQKLNNKDIIAELYKKGIFSFQNKNNQKLNNQLIPLNNQNLNNKDIIAELYRKGLISFSNKNNHLIDYLNEINNQKLNNQLNDYLKELNNQKLNNKDIIKTELYKKGLISLQNNNKLLNNQKPKEKELKDKFNDLIKYVKNEYNDISKNLLDNLKSNYDYALNHKLVKKSISSLFELIKILKNKDEVIKYLHILNYYIYKTILNNLNKFSEFINDIKNMYNFYKNFNTKSKNISYEEWANFYYVKSKGITVILGSIIALLGYFSINGIIKNEKTKKEIQRLEKNLEELQQKSDKYKEKLKRKNIELLTQEANNNNIIILNDSIKSIHKILLDLNNLKNYHKNINEEDNKIIINLGNNFFKAINKNSNEILKEHTTIVNDIKKIEKDKSNSYLNLLKENIKFNIFKKRNYEITLKDISPDNINKKELYLNIMKILTKQY